jgi:hypothetical protein
MGCRKRNKMEACWRIVKAYISVMNMESPVLVWADFRDVKSEIGGVFRKRNC